MPPAFVGPRRPLVKPPSVTLIRILSLWGVVEMKLLNVMVFITRQFLWRQEFQFDELVAFPSLVNTQVVRSRKSFTAMVPVDLVLVEIRHNLPASSLVSLEVRHFVCVLAFRGITTKASMIQLCFCRRDGPRLSLAEVLHLDSKIMGCRLWSCYLWQQSTLGVRSPACPAGVAHQSLHQGEGCSVRELTFGT